MLIQFASHECDLILYINSIILIIHAWSISFDILHAWMIKILYVIILLTESISHPGIKWWAREVASNCCSFGCSLDGGIKVQMSAGVKLCGPNFSIISLKPIFQCDAKRNLSNGPDTSNVLITLQCKCKIF